MWPHQASHVSVSALVDSADGGSQSMAEMRHDVPRQGEIHPLHPVYP